MMKNRNNLNTGDRFQVLDHGYVQYIEHWGSDERIIEAARMSTDKGFSGWGPHYRCRSCGCKWRNNHGTLTLFDADQNSCEECEGDTTACSDELPGDEKLLGYLYRNKHSTPFEMAGLTIEVGAPIFIFRQWHRHRTQSYNELSGRYTPMPAVDYVPNMARLMGQSGIAVVKNKQAGTVDGAAALTESRADGFIRDLAEYQALGQKYYEKALADGIPKELARLFVTVGRYSRMRASANLRNWIGFLSLRMDGHAQEEIRVYADAIGKMIEKAYPRTWKLFIEAMG